MKPRSAHVTAVAALGILAACEAMPDFIRPGETASSSSPAQRQAASLDSSGPTVSDQAFLAQAAYGGLGEVATGQLAAKQGASPAVRNFGTQMVNDHSRANKELVAVAQSKGISPPTAPDPGRQATASALASLRGANFDRQYLQQQLAEHEVAIALYQAQSQGGSDPQIRAFAGKWLPTLQDHHAMIRRMMPAMAAASPVTE